MHRHALLSLALAGFFSTALWAQPLPEAPWTPEEHASLVDLVNGCDGLIQAATRAIYDWRIEDDIERHRADYARAGREFAAASTDCLKATHYLFGAETGGGARAADVGRAVASLDAALDRSRSALELLPPTANRKTATKANEKLERFDSDRAYASFESADYPRMIGSHGDYPFAISAIATGQTKLAEAIADLMRLIDPSETPSFSEESRSRMAKAVSRTGAALIAANHAAALSAHVVDKRDRKRITQDVEASGGVRDANFFRAVLALEHVFCCGRTPDVVSGRQDARALANRMFSATQDFAAAVHQPRRLDTTLATLNGAPWLEAQMDRSRGGAAGEFYGDMLDAWQNLDHFGFGVMGFFHELPFPAPPGPIVAEGPLLPEAPWSPAEHASLVRIVETCEGLLDAAASSFDEWSNDGQPPDARRGPYTVAAQSLSLAFYNCGNGSFELFGAPNRRKGEERDDVVDDALWQLTRARLSAESAAAMLPDGLAKTKAAEATARLDSILTDNAYYEFRSSDYPNVIGLHGDYESAQRHLAHGVRYQAHSLWDIARLADPVITPRFSGYARAKLSEAAGHVVESARAAYRAATLEAFVITPEDWQRIETDTMAGKGLRPPSFFRTILALEYVFDKAGPPYSLSGRPDVPFSSPSSLAEAGLALADAVHNDSGSRQTLAALNGPGWLAAVLRRDGITIGEDRNRGLLAEFYADTFDLWPGLDNYGWAVMGFFHGVPAPPEP